MQINIEFYGRLKDQFSDEPIAKQIPPDSTVKSLFTLLCEEHQVTPNRAVIRPIINDTFVTWQQPIKDQDVVGFFPPAAGG